MSAARWTIALCLVSVFGAGCAGDTVWHVDDDGTPGASGRSWDQAIASLDDALRLAKPGDLVRVGAGVYRPVDPGGFLVPPGVTIEGALAGSTVLSGDALGDDGAGGFEDNAEHVLRVDGAAPPVVLRRLVVEGGRAGRGADPETPAAANTGAGLLAHLRTPADRLELDGCVFRDNVSTEEGGAIAVWSEFDSAMLVVRDGAFESNAVTSTSVRAVGGAIAVDTARVELRDSVFRANAAPAYGAVSLAECIAEIVGCRFVENEAGVFKGGAVGTTRVSRVRVLDTLFERNRSAEDAGAFYVFDSTVAFENGCRFLDNEAVNGDGGAVAAHRGASVELRGVVFDLNRSGRRGGAVIAGLRSWVRATDSVFVRSYARWDGGAVKLVNASDGEFGGCVFAHNGSTEFSGGAVHAQERSNLVVGGCFFLGNRTMRHNGGAVGIADSSSAWIDGSVFLSNHTPRLLGGAIRVGLASDAEITNSTFVNNTARRGGAIAAGGINDPRFHWGTIRNCVFFDNRGLEGPHLALAGRNPAGLDVDHSLVPGGRASVFIRPGFTLLWGENALDAEPRFVRPPLHGGDGWGDDPETPEDEGANDDLGDLALAPGSPGTYGADPGLLPPDWCDLDHDLDREEPTPLDVYGRPRAPAGAPEMDLGAVERSGDECTPRRARLEAWLAIPRIHIPATLDEPLRRAEPPVIDEGTRPVINDRQG